MSQWSNEEDGVARELEALLLQSAGNAWGIMDARAAVAVAVATCKHETPGDKKAGRLRTRILR